MEQINPYWLDAFCNVFSLCKIKASEKIAVLSEPLARQDNKLLAQQALTKLGLDFTLIDLAHQSTNDGPIIRSTGASTALDNHPEIAKSLSDYDVIIDMTLEGLMHAKQTAALLSSGARIMNISNEHPEVLARLTPVEAHKTVVKQAVQQCKLAQQMQVNSDAGTQLSVSMRNAATVGVWGWTDRPGTLAHWPAGLVVSFPAAGSVNGTLVMAPGDINLTFKRYIESDIVLSIENDYIVDIQGRGSDAALMRNYLTAFNEKEAYATSHVGWGLNTASRYEALTMYDKADINGTELRALAGNFLYSTGANEFAKRFTRGHFDLPIMNCTITLDEKTVVSNGTVVT